VVTRAPAHRVGKCTLTPVSDPGFAALQIDVGLGRAMGMDV